MWNIDPVLVRVGFVILTLSGGIGVILYLAGWLMVPVEGRDHSYLDEAIPQTRNWGAGVRIAIVAVACMIGVGALSWLMPFSMSAALVMAAVWYFGYYRNRPAEHRSRPQKQRRKDKQDESVGEPEELEQEQTRFIQFNETTPFTQAAEAWQNRIIEHLATVRGDRPESTVTARTASTGSSTAAPGWAAQQAYPENSAREAYFAHPDPVGLYTEADPAAPVAQVIDPQIARRKRHRRKLTLATLIVLGLTMTGLGIASAAGMAIATGTYLSAALLVLGLGLLVGTVVGRPPWIGFLSVVVALSMAATIFAGPYVEKASTRSLTYTAATLPASDHLDVGQLTVDLRQVKLEEAQAYSASVDAGRLEVFLPEGATMDVNGSVDKGMLQLPGQKVQTGNELTFHWPAPRGSDERVLTVHLRVDRGHLEVHR